MWVKLLPPSLSHFYNFYTLTSDFMKLHGIKGARVHYLFPNEQSSTIKPKLKNAKIGVRSTTTCNFISPCHCQHFFMNEYLFTVTGVKKMKWFLSLTRCHFRVTEGHEWLEMAPSEK